MKLIFAIVPLASNATVLKTVHFKLEITQIAHAVKLFQRLQLVKVLTVHAETYKSVRSTIVITTRNVSCLVNFADLEVGDGGFGLSLIHELIIACFAQKVKGANRTSGVRVTVL